MSRIARIITGAALAALVALQVTAAQAAEADLTKVIGTKKDGWTPVAFAKLKKGMTPAEVAKLFPGADKVSKFGFVTVASSSPVAPELEFYFAKDKKTNEPTELRSAKIHFAASVVYEELVKVCEAKFGKVKKQEEIEKKLITWIGPHFRSAQLMQNALKENRFVLDTRF